MASKENAAASLGKVDPSPLLQHFSTFFLRMYCSVAYWPEYLNLVTWKGLELPSTERRCKASVPARSKLDSRQAKTHVDHLLFQLVDAVTCIRCGTRTLPWIEPNNW